MKQFRSGNAMNNKNTHFRNDANPPEKSSFPDETLRREMNRMRNAQKSTQAAKRDHAGNPNYAIFGALIFCTLAVVFYQFWPTPVSSPIAEAEPPKTSPQAVYPAPLPKAADPNPIVNNINPAAKPKVEAEKQTAQTVQSEHIKAFKPNPFLEELAGSMKSSNVVVTPQAPEPNAVYPSQNCAVQIPFEGTVSGSHESLNLSVYTNQTENYQDKPLFEEPLLLEKTGVSHKYAIKAMLKLRPGLYYFVIENKKEETVAVGKFKVG